MAVILHLLESSEKTLWGGKETLWSSRLHHILVTQSDLLLHDVGHVSPPCGEWLCTAECIGTPVVEVGKRYPLLKSLQGSFVFCLPFYVKKNFQL